MFRSLRVRNYRLFLIGQLVSLVGTWMQAVAQDVLVLRLTGSGVALGLSMLLQFGPVLLIGLWGGAVADRYPKRRVLIGLQALMGVQALALAVAVSTGRVTLGLLYALGAVLGLAAAVEIPVRQAFVGEVVPDRDLPNAIALNSATFNTARIIGPALAALMIGLVGVGPVFWVNFVSYAAVIIGLLLMRTAELHPTLRSAVHGSVRDGLRYVRAHRELALVVGLTALVSTFGQNFRITLALAATEVFSGGPGLYGTLSSVIAVGALAGALFAASRPRPRQRTLVLCAVATGLGEVLMALMPSRLTFMLVLLPVGFVVVAYNATANAIMQLGSDPAYRGRVMALYAYVLIGGTPIGAPLLGWLSELAGPRFALGLGGAVVALGGLGAAALLGREQLRAALPSRRRVTVATPLDVVR